MSSDITVIEVYESAAQIGKDLERLIDTVGSDAVVELMPKVIRVLEQLESCVNQRESSMADLQVAQEELRRLRHAETTASDENLRIITEVKQLDDQRQQEIRDWMRMAKELQQQNGRLKAQLSEKEGIVVREKAHEQEAMQVLYQLKETVDRQRDQLRNKDDELKTRALEVDALQQHVDRLAKVSADLRRKNELLSTVAKTFIQEKSELQSELRALGKEGLVLGKEALVLGPMPAAGVAGGDIVDGGQQGQSPENGASESQERKESIPEANIVSVNMEGKAVIDLSDPNRPRFTLRELQTVLQERDELKLDIMELVDELEQYRPKDTVHLSEADQKEKRRTSTASKPKGEPSGIKRLFSFLFRGKNSSKISAATQGEGTWEFLEKPVLPAAESSGLTVPKPEQKARSSTLSGPLSSPPVPEGSPSSAPVEGGDEEGKQRSRSYTGPTVEVSHKEPFRQRERMTLVRTRSYKLVELGQDIASVTGTDSEQTPRVPASVSAGQPAVISRNNSNNADGEPHHAVLEPPHHAVLEPPHRAVLEPTGQRKEPGKEAVVQSAGAPKILLNNNDSDDKAGVEM